MLRSIEMRLKEVTHVKTCFFLVLLSRDCMFLGLFWNVASCNSTVFYRVQDMEFICIAVMPHARLDQMYCSVRHCLHGAAKDL